MASAQGGTGGAGITNEQLVWQTLLAEGATPVQAAGIMGNIQNESGFDPEYNNPSQGIGLIQWIGSYLTGSNPVPRPTGNIQADIQAQVKYLASTGGLKAASGATPKEAGQNFAMKYERCTDCGPGGSQTVARGNNAQAIYQQAIAGNWGTTPGTPAGSGSSSSSGSLPASGVGNLAGYNWLQSYAALLSAPGGWASLNLASDATVLVVRGGTFLLGALVFLGGLTIIVGVPVLSLLRGKARSTIQGVIPL